MIWINTKSKFHLAIQKNQEMLNGVLMKVAHIVLKILISWVKKLFAFAKILFVSIVVIKVMILVLVSKPINGTLKIQVKVRIWNGFMCMLNYVLNVENLLKDLQ
jgi:hypothetical protein